ncbi:Ig-like domain-containing protein [Tsukamurella sp. 8F]|uniref:L,D-transpeptidase n=1 Tax=unclassified Tsukamurella TaxID=2633480 RepID=UPI0023B965C2|nr:MULTISPECIES: Ig-like domain-containing protein [unclassified Tsukamurella]MDF0530626.1 Ig-like domain-containing protein [Tsukamurella sp. 8J]MDF0587827.1 Ig-like domain-containing protein [Tsukamurella sp. 8F]
MAQRVHRRSVLLGIAAAIPLTACTIGGSEKAGRSGSPATTTTEPPDPAVVTFKPADAAVEINPLSSISIGIAKATFDTVTVADPQGAPLEGEISSDRLSWKSNGPLKYSTQYTATVKYQTLGKDRTKTATFTTVKPPNMTLPYFENTSGNSLNDGATYGVGQVVVLHWDESISDRAAAQKLVTVETTPHVTGAWYWASDSTMHWRPQEYYRPGTQISITAKVFGKEVSPGLWGQEDQSISFRIGESHVSIADDNTKQVQVYVNGALVRTMPTSMGRGGTETVNGQTLTFWTQRGIYTVLDKANPVIMDSSTYGLPINSRLGYKEAINWATRISNDGIYLHALESTVWAQGNTDTSHGCLNLSPANAQWFYGISVPGDIVEVRNTGGAPLQLYQNGDWSVPWSTWVAGSALPVEN